MPTGRTRVEQLLRRSEHGSAARLGGRAADRARSIVRRRERRPPEHVRDPMPVR